MFKKVIVISPNPASFYTTSVCDLLIREGIQIQAVFVKKFSFKRFKDEFSRDGAKLLKKIWKKLVLRNRAYQDEEKDNILNFRNMHNISLSNVSELEKQGVDVFYVNNLNSQFVESKLQSYNTDLVVFTGGGLIRENILKSSGAGIMNCHMGVLPMYRGMDVIEWPILNEDFDNIGVTLHFMANGVDTGDILKIRKIPLKETDTIKNIRTRFEPVMVAEMVAVVLDFLNHKIKPVKQEITDGRQFFVISKPLLEKSKVKLANRLK